MEFIDTAEIWNGMGGLKPNGRFKYMYKTMEPITYPLIWQTFVVLRARNIAAIHGTDTECKIVCGCRWDWWPPAEMKLTWKGCWDWSGASTLAQDSFGMFISWTGANLCIQNCQWASGTYTTHFMIWAAAAAVGMEEMLNTKGLNSGGFSPPLIYELFLLLVNFRSLSYAYHDLSCSSCRNGGDNDHKSRHSGGFSPPFYQWALSLWVQTQEWGVIQHSRNLLPQLYQRGPGVDHNNRSHLEAQPANTTTPWVSWSF